MFFVRLKSFFTRLFEGSIKRMIINMNCVHEETGKNRFIMFFDILWCAVRYSVGHLDYRVLGFALVKGKDRKTFLTMNHNLKVANTLNDKSVFYVFNDKTEFDRRYSQYLGRDFIDLHRSDAKALEEFCKGRKTVFAKSTEDFGGAGMSREVITPDIDYAKMYERLCKNGQYLVEEEIKQHEQMSMLCPASVNTVRIATINYQGQVHFMYALLRVGNGVNCVDNICSGGMYVIIGEDGLITKNAYCNDDFRYYEKHPVTGVSFAGFKVPYFNEAVEMCKKAAEIEPRIGYVGWDVAITDKGPVLVEGNTMPSYALCQNHLQNDGGKGILPKYEAVLGKDFFK